jgi:hypothetical protein
MYCRFCGSIIPDDSNFCEACGKHLGDAIGSKNLEESPELEYNNSFNGVNDSDPWSFRNAVVVDDGNQLNFGSVEPKVWKVFGILGLIIGIISFIICWIPLYTCFISIYGIVFGAIGKKSIIEGNIIRANWGLALSIISFMISFIVFISLING